MEEKTIPVISDAERMTNQIAHGTYNYAKAMAVISLLKRAKEEDENDKK